MKPILLSGGRSLDLSGPALVMAIVNCNDDSFYAPSRAIGRDAVEMAKKAEAAGASIIDFGAESSRPGSSYISAEEEADRLIPVVKAFRESSALPVSVDTRKAEVAMKALDAGADIINDISGLEDDGQMASLCAGREAPIVLMHKKGIPLTMQEKPHYDDLVIEMKNWFDTAINRAMAAGIRKDKIILDPGIGFGKNLNHNLEIIRRLAEIFGNDYPVLVGLSRKGFIGDVTADTLSGTLAANAAAIMNGAGIIRVHDVGEHAALAKMLFAVRSGRAQLS